MLVGRGFDSLRLASIYSFFDFFYRGTERLSAREIETLNPFKGCSDSNLQMKRYYNCINVVVVDDCFFFRFAKKGKINVRFELRSFKSDVEKWVTNRSSFFRNRFSSA